MTASTATLNEVRRAAGSYARGREDLVNRIAEGIDAGGIAQGKQVLTQSGYGAYGYLLDRINLASEQPVSAEGGFSREHAVEVITAYAASRGVSAETMRPVLQEAGLIDADPEPEPESVDPSLFSRLVSFARGHGFQG